MIALILGVVAVLGVVALVLSFQSAFPPMREVPASVAWQSHDLVLSDDHAVVHGRLTLSMTGAPTSKLRVGLNAGVPAIAPGTAPSSSTLDPAALLATPSVRLTAVMASGRSEGCYAPCELELPLTQQCASACQVDYDIAVELVAGETSTPQVVRIGVAGGATAPLDEHLPEGFKVDLAFDQAATPEGS